jgi:phage-related protein
MQKFSKPINVKLLDEATCYFDEIDEKIKAKFFKSFEKVESGHKGDWFKHLEDEIWEFRERDSSKFYRIFAFWDSTPDKQTLIVGTHGLDKKSNKTPRNEIEKAKRCMYKYFEQKKDKI